ncbi:MAG: hypothetical protein Q8K45_21230 [Rubrivivax sp.]|nr:hypothetical protein [Rubrivivax sp.]
MNSIDIYVRYSCAAYVTNTKHGIRSSSTMSASAAANLQAQKLFGPALQSVTCVDDQGLASVWRVRADADKVAWCWATGLIEFGDEVPADAVAIAFGPDRALRSVVEVAARNAKPSSGGQLLVPGVPEARDQQEGMAALLSWMRWHGKGQRAKRQTCGVSFFRVPGEGLPERYQFERSEPHPGNPAAKGRKERQAQRTVTVQKGLV